MHLPRTPPRRAAVATGPDDVPLDLARAYPVHAAAASSGDGVVIFGGGVPCLSFAPVFGDSVRVVMT